MTYRMMGGCLGAAWDGPHRAAYASPAVGGPSHVQAFAWGRCRNPTAPAGAVQSVSRRSPLCSGDWARRASGFRRRPLTTTKRRTTQMNLGGFIDTFKDAIARRVVESYPPLYRPSENGGTLPRLLRRPLGAQADAIRGAALSLEGPPGHHRRRRDGHGQDLHRRGGGAHGRFRADSHHLPAPPGAQVEAGGGDDGARRHAPPSSSPSLTWSGSASPSAPAPSSRSMSAGEGQAVVALDARRDTAEGRPPGAGSFGTRRRASRSGCPAAPAARRRSSTRTACPSPTRT